MNEQIPDSATAPFPESVETTESMAIADQVRLAAEQSPDEKAQLISDLPPLSQDAKDAFLRSDVRLETAAEIMQMLRDAGVLEYANVLIEPMVALQPDQREAYVNSMRQALQDLAEATPGASSQAQAVYLLAQHRDPQAALTLAMRAFPGKPLPTALWDLNDELDLMTPDATKRPIVVPEQLAAVIPELNDALNVLNIPSHNILNLAKKTLAIGRSTTETLVSTLAHALQQTADMRIHMHDTANLGHTDSEVNGRTLNALQLSNEELASILQSDSEPDEIAMQLDRFAAKQYAASKDYEFLRRHLRELRSIERGKSEAPDTSPPADYMTMLRQRGLESYFDGLRVPDEMQGKLFTAWKSYSGVRVALSNNHKLTVGNLTDIEIDRAAAQTAKVLYEQLTAMQDYCEKYGVDEMVELHETFGIVNFTRASAEQFHDQLVAWKDPRQPVKNINTAGTGDHNFAFGDAANSFFTQFGTEGSFYFEVASATELARVMVRVGDRERSAGRLPWESEAGNIVISGHGGPRGITFSPGNTLDVEQFAQARMAEYAFAAKGGAIRPNDFRQHIGSNYRLILDACSAGKEIERINISQLLSREYGVQTEGPSDTILGYKLDEDSNVSFDYVNKNN